MELPSGFRWDQQGRVVTPAGIRIGAAYTPSRSVYTRDEEVVQDLLFKKQRPTRLHLFILSTLRSLRGLC